MPMDLALAIGAGNHLHTHILEVTRRGGSHLVQPRGRGR
uniref:Uncharacterized protein n=1 Tax=Dulem virus 38 TaxID=3145756 RepID=A0AAU8B444_9CAUD